MPDRRGLCGCMGTISVGAGGPPAVMVGGHVAELVSLDNRVLNGDWVVVVDFCEGRNGEKKIANVSFCPLIRIHMCRSLTSSRGYPLRCAKKKVCARYMCARENIVGSVEFYILTALENLFTRKITAAGS